MANYIYWAIMLLTFYGCAYRKLDKHYKSNKAYVSCHVGGYFLFCLAPSLAPFMNYRGGDIPTLLFFLIFGTSLLIVSISYILHARLQHLEGGISADKLFVYRHQKLTLICHLIGALGAWNLGTMIFFGK